MTKYEIRWRISSHIIKATRECLKSDPTLECVQFNIKLKEKPDYKRMAVFNIIIQKQ
jgi:hypothetical protein